MMPMRNQSGATKHLVAVLLVLVVAAVVALSWPKISGDDSEKDKEKIIEALQQYSMARALGDVPQVIKFISNDFNDAGMDYKSAIKALSKKKQGYTTFYMNASLAGILAKVSYKRLERVDGKAVTTVVLEELWKKGDDGNWRLFKFAKVDREAFTQASVAGSAEKKAERGKNQEGTRAKTPKKSDTSVKDVVVATKKTVGTAEEEVPQSAKALKTEEVMLSKTVGMEEVKLDNNEIKKQTVLRRKI